MTGLKDKDINTQEGYVLKLLNFSKSQYHLGWIVNQTKDIMHLVYEQSPDGKFINFDTPFYTDSAYDKYLMYYFSLGFYLLRKAKHDHRGIFDHTIGRIKHISYMSRIDMCYKECQLGKQIVSP